MEKICQIQLDINSNIKKTVVLIFKGDELRAQKKAAALKIKTESTESVTTKYAALLADIDSKLQTETDQTVIADLNTQRTALLNSSTAALNAINNTYTTACQAADDEYAANRLSALQPGFEVIPQAEFDKIGTESALKMWDASTQSIIDKPDANTTRATNENIKRIATIKQKAGELINGRYPLQTGKQNNMIARMTELLLTMQAGALTQAETDELSALQSAWSWVKAVRNASNEAEAAGISVEAIRWPV